MFQADASTDAAIRYEITNADGDKCIITNLGSPHFNDNERDTVFAYTGEDDLEVSRIVIVFFSEIMF